MKKILTFIPIIFVLAVLVGCGGNGEITTQLEETEDGGVEPTNLVWIAGPSGGGWHSMATGISSLVKEEHPNINIRVVPGGLFQNIPLLAEGEADIAWNWAAIVGLAAEGEDPLEEAYPNIVTLGNGLGVNHFHFFTKEDSELETLDDVFENPDDLRMAISPVHVGDDYAFQRILEHYDTTIEELESQGAHFFRGSYTEQTEQFKNDNVDVVFTMGGIPSSTITDAASTRDIKFLPMSDGLRDHLEQYAFVKDVIPAGTYPEASNGDEDIPVNSASNALIVRDDISEDVVYLITKTINENLDRLPEIHGSLASYEVESAVESVLSPIHPGAEEYYREIDLIE